MLCTNQVTQRVENMRIQKHTKQMKAKVAVVSILTSVKADFRTEHIKSHKRRQLVIIKDAICNEGSPKIEHIQAH